MATTMVAKKRANVMDKIKLKEKLSVVDNDASLEQKQPIYRWPWPHGKTDVTLPVQCEDYLDYESIDKLIHPRGLYNLIETYDSYNQFIWIRDSDKRLTRLRKMKHEGFFIYPYLTTMGKIIFITIL